MRGGDDSRWQAASQVKLLINYDESVVSLLPWECVFRRSSFKLWAFWNGKQQQNCKILISQLLDDRESINPKVYPWHKPNCPLVLSHSIADDLCAVSLSPSPTDSSRNVLLWLFNPINLAKLPSSSARTNPIIQNLYIWLAINEYFPGVIKTIAAMAKKIQ